MKYNEIADNAGLQRVFRARYKLDQPGLISHITQRAAGKEPLFLEENDYLARAVVAALDDKTLNQSITATARDKVVNEFDWGVTAEKYQALYTAHTCSLHAKKD